MTESRITSTQTLSKKDEDNISFYDRVNDRIPDVFDVTHLSNNKNGATLLHFEKLHKGFKKSLKYWVENEILLINTSPSHARESVSIVHNALTYIQKRFPLRDPHDIQESHYDFYINHLISRVRSNKNDNEKLGLNTAYYYCSAFTRYLQYLNDEGIFFYSFIHKKIPIKIFPYGNPQRFFTGEELKEYLDKLEEKRSEKPLKYPHLIEVMDSLTGYEDILLKNLCIIMAHTGLRLTEVLHLKDSCIEEVDSPEIKSANKIRGSAILDWKESYWLDYLTIKGKHSEWVKGTPILVGKEVKKAVSELTEHKTSILKSGKDCPSGLEKFLSLAVFQGNVTLLGSSGFNAKRRKFIGESGVKYFTAHQFRHTYAKMLHDSGIPIEYIRKYLNHIHDDMTTGYIQRDIHKTAQKYEAFTDSKVFAGKGAKKAYALQKKINEAIEHPEFKAMGIDERSHLLDSLADSEDMDVHAMDHGMCLIPKDTSCPNNFTDINSCFEQNCGQFAATETSIPHFTKLINYKKGWIEDFERTGHIAAAEEGKKNLLKSIDILENLKKGEYFEK